MKDIKYTYRKDKPFNEKGLFEQECPNCGEINEVVTQADNNPEYYTRVTTKCSCGTSIDWQLPVN
jgi:phage FluMu protein Com